MNLQFYKRIILGTRAKPSEMERTLSEEFTSDKSRVIFSSSFRRLQQKAQVFSLETNAAVRSRLTHTLEVATIGITIAEKIASKLLEKGHLTNDLVLPFIKIVENACLLHDLGNPPFGHFAEAAIKKWFDENWEKTFKESTHIEPKGNPELIIKTLINDFLLFDGNPQAVRIAVKLQDVPNSFNDIGMNLTYSQIASIVKYNATPGNVNRDVHLLKKPGYFYSEQAKIEKIKEKLGYKGRYPLTYIMEAADDISYCLSDIEDGIEKQILTPEFFFSKLKDEYKCVFYTESKIFTNLINNTEPTKKSFFEFKIKLVRILEEHAISRYLEKEDGIFNGSLAELIDKESDEGKMLKCLKVLSRKYLFRSREAENKELAGYHAMKGILDKYKNLLELDNEKFFDLVDSKHDLNKVLGHGLDLQWRLFNRLPERHLEAYRFEYEQCQKKFEDKNDDFKQWEWFNRAHLIVDYISGMTDNYVLETYNLLYGIKV